MIHQLFELFNFLGSEWVLVILGILSITVVALALGRISIISKISSASHKFWTSYGDRWVDGTQQGAWRDQIATTASCLERDVLATVDRHKELSTADVERHVDATIEHRRMKLEKSVSVLGTIGANAAFVGLLGTVLGIIRAFHDISAGGVQSGIENISGGIAEALVATAVGIFVAIISVVLYNYLNRRIGMLCRKAALVGELAVAALPKK